MLRILYTILDIISAVLAILSPVAIIHWMLLVLNFPDLFGAVSAMERGFHPLNQMAEGLVTFIPMVPHTVEFNGHSVSIAQGVVGILSTLSFFVIAYIAIVLKSLDKRMRVTRETVVHQLKIKQRQSQEKRSEKQLVSLRRTLVYFAFEAEAQPTVAAYLRGYQRFEGNLIQNQANSHLIEFKSLRNAFEYALEVSREVKEYYQSLRPMDLKPPFRMSIHAVAEGEDNTVTGLDRCQATARYAADNQVLCSAEINELLVYYDLKSTFDVHSLGMFDFAANQHLELFLLTVPFKNKR
ncbi:MAG: hypothetical protein K2X01_05620 [Cyanobacteria bacterium]|nr:hypothetical protein [Cyanobacteriota bacterium]